MVLQALSFKKSTKAKNRDGFVKVAPNAIHSSVWSMSWMRDANTYLTLNTNFSILFAAFLSSNYWVIVLS